VSLSRQVFEAFGGQPVADLQAFAREEIQRHGSGRAAARALGVDEKTVRRWKNGETRASERFDQATRQARAENAQRVGSSVSVEFRYAKRTRPLTFEEGKGVKGLKPGTVDKMKDAYVRGDADGMAQAFVRGVTDGWYGDEMRRAYAVETGEEGEDKTPGEDSDAVGSF
jgi:hypothetical protein